MSQNDGRRLQDGKVFGMEDDFGKLDVMKAPRWTPEMCEFLKRISW